MFIAVNTIAGPGGNPGAVEGFKRAIASMKQFQGFLGLEIWTAEDGSMQAVSRWTSKEALDEYLNHPMFQRHHSGSSRDEASRHATVSYYTAEQIG